MLDINASVKLQTRYLCVSPVPKMANHTWSRDRTALHDVIDFVFLAKRCDYDVIYFVFVA